MPQNQLKKSYTKPKFVEYGDMRDITKNVGTKGGDSAPALHSR